MMLSKRWQGLMMIALAVTLTLAFALPAQAQRDTGIMNVQALDPDGAPLPGVMVVARGPVGTQTQYTGVDGTARFPACIPVLIPPLLRSTASRPSCARAWSSRRSAPRPSP
jgi:hypothetical protein